MTSPLLLDTCAAIWLAQGTLDPKPARLLGERLDAGEPLFVSPITAWELGLLFARGRLRSPLGPVEYFRRLAALPLVVVLDLTAEVLIASSFLPGEPPRDPADRILAATAREGGYTLMTRDPSLLRYAAIGHLRAAEC